MELFLGAPENEEGRLPRELRVYSCLNALHIPYHRVDHAAANTMEACAEIDKVLGVEMCKNLFLCNRQKTSFYLLLMPASKPFKTKELSAQINSARLSFADAQDMERYLDLLPGSVSVLGLMNDTDRAVTLLIDRDLCRADHIGCHPCVSTSSLKLKLSDILHVFLPAVNHFPTYVTLLGDENV